MRYFITLFLIILSLGFTSCRKDFSVELSSGNLSFSKDTIYLDTVFTNIGSSTYNLKVYNHSNHAISIPSIQLENGLSSFYRLNVDGVPGKQFENVEVLAKDSLYIFVETTIDINQVANPIYEDNIVFDSGANKQHVKLITLVKDAHFLYPSKDKNGLIETIKIGLDAEGNSILINGFYLNDNTTFTNEKPYVIYGYCALPEGKTLTINAGSHLYFHANSGLIINKNASLVINGELNNEVIIEGDRLESQFDNIPGQWGTIWLRAGSKNHSINNTLIKNGSAGIILDSIGSNTEPTLKITNTQIYNQSNFGILARETNLKGENVVINNCGQISLACTIGGTYNFTHSTFTNYWNQSVRTYPAVFINNYFTYTLNNQQVIETRDLLAANFINCTIDGSKNIELNIDKVEGSTFNFLFENNLIRFNDFNNTYSAVNEYNFEDATHFSNNIFNGNPDFKSTTSNELIIGENSDAIQKASSSGTAMVPLDILGVTRNSPADIGAYEHIIFN